MEEETATTTRERAPELRAFHELARVVSSGPYSAPELLERIGEEVRSGFGFTGALVLRLDAAGEAVRAVIRQNADWPHGPARIDTLPALAEVRDAGQALVATAEWPGGEHESRVVVPLTADERCLGFLLATGLHGDETFGVDQETLALLSALGAVAAVFVDKADHYGALAGELAELQHIDRVKTDFVGIASHELRTPIAVVHGIASTLHLRGHELDDQQVAELRRTLYAQTTRLAELTQSLLDLSRIESGALQPQPQRLRPRARVDALLDEIAPDRRADIRVEIPEALELVTDAEGLERVVGNLVANALRHGAPPIVIRAYAGQPFRLVVRDHGTGVDPAFADRLFDRFARGGHGRSSGAGLGLAIARSYANALGGDLRYAQVDPGACFELTLPD